MTYATVTLSSVGTSPPVNLNWIGGKPTTLTVSASATGLVGTVIVQYSLDDSQRISSSLISWYGFSSNTYSIDALQATVYTTSTIFPDGIYVPIPTPVAAVRMNSSALAASTTLTMKVVQGEGW